SPRPRQFQGKTPRPAKRRATWRPGTATALAFEDSCRGNSGPSTTVSRSALRCAGARAQLGREQSEERLPGRRELTCAAIHDADRAAEGTFDGRSGHQGARANLGNEGRRRQERQPEAGLNGALDRLDVVELHGVVNPHPVTAQEAVDQPAGGNVAVETDERLAVENGERTAGAPRDGVAGRGSA